MYPTRFFLGKPQGFVWATVELCVLAGLDMYPTRFFLGKPQGFAWATVELCVMAGLGVFRFGGGAGAKPR